MRYLSKRDEFLKNYNNIVKIKNEYIPDAAELVKEDAGPFVNDIGWGDSLLGRAISSTFRKIMIGVNLVKIKDVEQRLRDAMEELLLNSSVAELDEDDKKLYARALISTYLLALQDAVKKGEPMEQLKNLTETAISAAEESKDLEGKNELVRQLKEWLKFLNQFKEEEAQEGQEEGQKEEESMGATGEYLSNFKYLFNMLLIFKGIETERIEYNKGKSIQKNSGEASRLLAEADPLYQAFMKKPSKTNFQSIKAKLDEILKLDPANAGAQKRMAEIEKRGTPLGRKKGTKNKVATTIKNPAEAGGNISTVTGAETTTGVTANNNSVKSLMKYGDFMRINEGVAKAVGNVAGKIWKFITGSKDERVLDKDTENLWNSLNQIYKMFVHLGEAGENGALSKNGEMQKFLSLTPAQIKADPKLKQAYNRYKSNIDKIYGFVRSANGISEGVHEVLGKSEEMGKKIAALYSVTNKKPDGRFMQYPGTVGEVWDELVENIAGFNKTMDGVLGAKSKWNVGDKASWKSERTGNTRTEEILRIEGKKLVFKDKKGEEYTKFMSEVDKVEESSTYALYKRIFEAQEDEEAGDADESSETQAQEEEEGQVSKWKNPNSITKIQDWWGKNMDIERWVIEKTEVEKVRINLDKKLAAKKDSVVIDGMDPVLEIVKVFNRAYKLHTTQVIPSGRSGGKVSNSVFREYHCFGSGTPANAGESGGPYRNHAIFNQWEDCVNDVKRDKRYQCIFNAGTRLKVGNEFIEKAGMNLRKFMTDMIDGDELYKGGSGKEQGAQAKFLDKYFGYKAEADGKDTTYGGSEERQSISELSAGIKSVKLGLVDGNTELKFESKEDLIGTFFCLKRKDSSNKWWFCIQDVKNGIAYLSYAETAFHMREYIKKDKMTSVEITPDFGKAEEKDSQSNIWMLSATTANIDTIFKDGKINLLGTIEMGNIHKKLEERGSRENKVDNKASESVTEESKVYTVDKAYWVINLEEGSVSGDQKRIKVKKGSIKSVIESKGGFSDIANIPNISNVKIKKP